MSCTLAGIIGQHSIGWLPTIKVSKCNHFMTASIVNKCITEQSLDD